MLTPISQIITHGSFASGWYSFLNDAGSCHQVQARILENSLKKHPYLKSKKDFLSLPPAGFDEQISRIQIPHGTRLQPTSGSGHQEKLVPYTKPFLQQLNRALNPWLFDMARSYPGILNGSHYWSISWLPTSWREKGWELDDSELLPSWKKSFLRNIMAVPSEVSRAETLSASQFATLAFLAGSHDLSFVSVWSPTFFLNHLKLLKEWKTEIAATLESGSWQKFKKELSHLKAPRSPVQAKKLTTSGHHDLWPRLALISSWASSTSTEWATELQENFPGVSFQGKGLWATEGVVTIPFQGKNILAYQSHFYEFLDPQSGNILQIENLKEGMEVYPLLTTANGFARYHMKDRLVVSGKFKSVPALEFLEREDSFDMVGEKLDNKVFLNLHDHLKIEFPDLKWVIAFAVKDPAMKPYYLFVLEGLGHEASAGKLISGELEGHFHYHLAQELGQLGECRVIIRDNSYSLYEKFQLSRGMVQGNIKVELTHWIKGEKALKLLHEIFGKIS